VRPILAYTHRPGPLGDGGALAATAYLAALALAALVTANPIVIAGAGAGVVIAGTLSGAGAALRLSARWALGLGIVLVVVNAFASQRGDTVLVHGIVVPILGTLDISLEAIVEGAVLALRLGIVMLAFAVHATSVDPDGVLRLLRPLASRSALTATLIARMVPLAAADYARLGEAAALRGPGAAAAGRAALARRLVAGSLDRAVDVAATLELRGYAKGAPRRAASRRRSRHDLALYGSALLIAGVSIAAAAAGLGGYRSYPTIVIDNGAATLAVAAALPLLAAIPFARDRARQRRG
jgi:energy-coupling factor transport system permease protein